MAEIVTSQEVPASADKNGSTPPYVAWTTLQNAIERMEGEGDVPSRIDRSYLKNMPGSTQSRFRHACRWLGLVDGDEVPTETLRLLALNPDRRKEAVAQMLREHYPSPLALPKNATQGMLEEAFREMGSSPGDTLRKSIAFFLHACNYAEIELSKQFMQPRQPRGASDGTRKPRRKSTGTPAATEQLTPEPQNEAPNIIRDLLTKLPAEGSKWHRKKAEQWLGIAKLTFEMVYELEGSYTDSTDPDAAGVSKP